MTDTARYLVRTHSPIGRIEILADSGSLISLAIERDGRLPHDNVPAAPSRLLKVACRQLDEYFSSSRTSFELPLRFDGGTPFQREVWAELTEIEFGATISYGEIADRLGKPGSGRSIGGAVAANPMPILIGCHRVLSSQGAITGYSQGSGIPTKAWLLGHEGSPFSMPVQREEPDVVGELFPELV